MEIHAKAGQTSLLVLLDYRLLKGIIFQQCVVVKMGQGQVSHTIL